MQRRRLAAILALAAFAALTQGADSCSDTSSDTTGQSSAPSPGAAAPTPTTGDSTPAEPAAKPQTFRGTGQKDLGTIVVHTDSTLSWNCPTCTGNFIINNAANDPGTIPTNALDQTKGVDPIPAGTYHTVVVNTEGGPWTIRIAPG